jgi:glucose/arabinose dehydrogenase
LSVRFDGSGLRVVARGLRNPYGLVYADGLYATVNGRDDLGTWEPAEAVVRVRQGAHFGWPGCWPSWRLRRLVGECRGVSRPLAYLEPHSAAGGIIGTSGNSFLVAEWGQYDSRRFGRKVVRIDRTTGRVTLFARGFDHPLALATDPAADAVLVGDWGRGIIYRIVRRARGA